ncbi:Hypothetical protein SCF082_LOCUS16396 [Durusdinium trenchii]|uniref:Uncharacterized protein n=1 Tax=Durusdinium trenchii TaxID=1381693 RepID=A0ABP0KCF2_9DINO
MDVGRSVEKAQEQEDLLEQSEEGPSSSLTGRPVLISSAALRLKVAAALGLLGTVGLALCLFPAASRSLRGVGLSSSGTAGQAWQDSGGCPEAPLLDFYMYRSQTDENYSPVNQDMANIGGMLWYMHNEIIWHHWIRVGSFSSIPKTRIEQWRVKMRPTCALWKKGMAFGIVNTYDIGKCTGPFKCENLQHYGPTVGCETWNPGTNNHWPHEEWYGRVRYPNAAWYSLPGECASRKFWAKDQECARTEPSGACPAGKEPTGEWDCTYTYEKVEFLGVVQFATFHATRVPLTLRGTDISSFDDLMKKGGYEYSRATDEVRPTLARARARVVW